MTTIFPDTQYGNEGTQYNDGFGSALDPDAAIDEELGGAADASAQDADIDSDDDGQEDASARASKGGSKPNNRAQFRRVAQKALDVHAATETARTLAASVLGCPSTPADLAAYIMTAPRQSTSPLADIAQVAEEIAKNPLMAGIIPASWEMPRVRAVWAVLHGLGAVTTASAPASSAKAAGLILPAVAGFSEEDQTELAHAAELLKRS